MFRYTYQPDGIVLRALTIVNVILGVTAATLMPIHVAFMHRNAVMWCAIYAFDVLHGMFMYVYTVTVSVLASTALRHSHY